VDGPEQTDQVRKDRVLRTDANTPIDASSALFPKSDNTIGPSDELRDLLEAGDIPFRT
jgi:hypothetical protein